MIAASSAAARAHAANATRFHATFASGRPGESVTILLRSADGAVSGLEARDERVEILYSGGDAPARAGELEKDGPIRSLCHRTPEHGAALRRRRRAHARPGGIAPH